MTSAAPIHFNDISYAYAGAKRAALQAINIRVQPGEIVTLVGPSGCGKSTLLRIVAGLIAPTSGQLLIDHDDATRMPVHKRRVGWVPQSYALFEHLNVIDNISFGLRMQGLSAVERLKTARDMLSLCRIEDLAHRNVNDISGGQRQRVAIARALAVRPRVLLLDEPLAALDPQLRTALRADLEILLRDTGVTTIFVTHDQGEALAVADRVAVLRDGKLEQFDTPECVWATPANSFVAEFFGADIVRCKIVAPHQVELAPGLRAITSCDRPDGMVRIVMRATDWVPHRNGTPLRVTQCEYAGGTFHVRGTLPDGQPVGVVLPTRASVGDIVNIAPRDNISLHSVDH
jgi:ABC-type Fe3+/spermidine/putrescine transport system ATPase subunit